MHPIMKYDISPESIRDSVKKCKIISVILALTTVIFLILSLFEYDVITFVILWFYAIFAVFISYIFEWGNKLYKAYLFEDHIEIVNWLNRCVRFIKYDEISVIRVKILKDVLVGPHPRGKVYMVNTLCIGINITEDELDGLTERNTFMDLLRYSIICVPMAYNEEVYQFIKSKINPSGDCI